MATNPELISLHAEYDKKIAVAERKLESAKAGLKSAEDTLKNLVDLKAGFEPAPKTRASQGDISGKAGNSGAGSGDAAK